MLLAATMLLAACSSEILEKQAEQIRQQEEHIAQQRKEIETLLTAQKQQDQKRVDCNRAFRDYFEKANAVSDRPQAVQLYRDGLKLCPDDDVAHYELGKLLAASGRPEEAAKAFAAALKINPGFVDAKNQLDTIQKTR